MGAERSGDDLEPGTLPARLDSDHPKDRDLLDRLSAKLLRLEREALHLATTMRGKPKLS
ncbi:MAG: hypothetical protein U1F37_11090 [Alphaproteobacteria bacterium]